MENLPLEITENVLSRLPTASKSQAREVCKTWRTLIPKPKRGLLYGVSSCRVTKLEELYFSEQNIDKVDDNYCGALTKLNHCMTLRSLPSFSSFKTFMVGSYHGLVCYAAYASYAASNSRERITVCICNPFTGEQIEVPTAYKRVTYAELGIGFGYNHSSNKYKVVRILLDKDDHQDGTIKVYTLQGGTAWRNSKSLSTTIVQKFFKPHLGRVGPIPSVGVFAGGALHWLDKSGTVILAFDLEYETLNLLPSIPFGVRDDIVGLMELGGNLCVLQVALTKHFKIREFRNRKTVRYTQKGSPWVTKFTIPWNDWSWVEHFCLPMSSKYSLWHNVMLSCYDPETKTLSLRKVEETSKKFLEDCKHFKPSIYTTTRATPFMPSRVSLKANTKERVGKKRKAP